MNSRRDTASVVHNADHFSRQQFNIDARTVSGERLVYRVIHNFVYQMMQSLWSG